MKHIHIILPEKHDDFLAEERKDPVTGEIIAPYSEVVFCGECSSAFLKDSWEYIGERHCSQSSTLPAVPQSMVMHIKKGQATAHKRFKMYSQLGQVSFASRLPAFLVDFFIMTLLNIFLYPLGYIYFILRDSVGGQSVGKAIAGIISVDISNQKPIGLGQSLLRNMPFIGLVFLPSFFDAWGMLFFWVLAEFIGTVGFQKTLGDVLSKTRIMHKTHYLALNHS